MANVYDSATGFIYKLLRNATSSSAGTVKIIAYAGSSDIIKVPGTEAATTFIYVTTITGWYSNSNYYIEGIESFLDSLNGLTIKNRDGTSTGALTIKVPTSITIPKSIHIFDNNALSNTIIKSVIYDGASNLSSAVGTTASSGLVHYIPSLVIGTTVLTLKKYYKRGMTAAATVTIPETLTMTIIQGAGLASITPSVIGIAANAFEGCDKVTGVVIGINIKSIGSEAFKSSGLIGISVPITVDTEIPENAFTGCTSLEYILAGDPAKVASITSAGTNTYICSGTTDIILNNYIGTAPAVTIPSKIPSTASADNVQIIGVGCFKDLAITSVTIPTSVTSIGASAFEGCNSLTTITIPASVTSIGASALATTSPTSVIYGGSLSTAIVGTTATSGLAHYDGTTLKKYYPRAMAVGTVTIPASVTSIGANAFEGATVLTSVTIGTGVTSIGAQAFKSTGLTIVTIPASVTTIGAGAFEGCTELLSVDILRTTAFTTLGADILKSCTKLQGIKVGAAEVTITDAVFGITGTTRVYLYTGTTLLKYFPRGSPNDLHFVTDGDKHVGASDAVKFATIAAGAFSGVGQLQKLTIRGSTTIKSGAFTGCTNLYGIVVIDGTLENNSVSNSLTSSGYILVDSGTIGNGADGTNPVFPSTANTVNRVVNSGFNSTYTNLFGSGYGNRTSSSSKPVYVNGIGTDTFDKKYIDSTRYENLKNFFTSSAVVLDTSYLDSVIESDTLSDEKTDLTTTNQDLTTQLGSAGTISGGVRTGNTGVQGDLAVARDTNTGLTNTNQGLTATIAGNREDLIKSINQKVKSINFAIDEIKNEQNRNNRHSYFFSQDNYINVYRNRVALILYYIVFILLALSLYMNRESYSIVMIVVLLILFALLPFVIKYITRFAYNQFLNLLKLFYDGNVRYTNTKIE
jgi:hypothetical protein